MREGNPWSRLREEWEVLWVKPSGKDGLGDPAFPHTYVVTRSGSLKLLLQANVSQQQMVKELVGLLEAINEGLLDDLEHEVVPHGTVVMLHALLPPAISVAARAT
jgi:hypothetical protein